MVESPKYERLKAVIGLTARPLASEDYEEDGRASTARTEVEDAKGTSEDFVVERRRVADQDWCRQLAIVVHRIRENTPRKDHDG